MNKFLSLLLAAISISAAGQKQLLVLKDEEVLLRLYPGDEIIFKLKDNDRKWVTYVNNLSDTSLVTHRDTIPFHKIERVFFDQDKFHNRLGRKLVAAGAALFLVDQFNNSVVQGNDFDVDGWVSAASLAGIGAGLPMMLLRQKSQKLNHRHKLMMADRNSPFFRPDTREIIE